MRATFLLPLAMMAAAAAAPARAQTGAREPDIGYVYPAGARQGATVRVFVGGQNLRGARGAHVSGRGVRARVVRHMGRIVRLNGKERAALWQQLAEVRRDRGLEASPVPRGVPGLGRKKGKPGKGKGRSAGTAKGKAGAGQKAGAAAAGPKDDPELIKLQRHPLLSMLPELTVEELDFVEHKFIRYDFRQQPNAQLGETVLVEVTVEEGAEPGDRELRLLSGRGLSNPLCFQVGQLPEVREPHPSDVRPAPGEPVDLPAVLNGQITPGDVDLFLLRARKGQKLVMQAHARRLVPFLADAVPGWFQATLTLRDGQGRLLAYEDDFRFDPDPVLLFEVPRTGVYSLEVRDAIYRGRDDFVYRVEVSEKPFVRSAYPIGGCLGSETVARLRGWNLGTDELPLDTATGPDVIRMATLLSGGAVSNPVTYAVDPWPDAMEVEPNDDPGRAALVPLPAVVNGRIVSPGDRDLFRFEGRAGDVIVAEVTARRLRSPLDALLRIQGPEGRVLAWNDDTVHKQGHLHRVMGLLTHHADAYLRFALPADGTYAVEVADVRGHGSPAHAYRLRLGPPRPDFELRITPSALNLPAGRAAVLHVYAHRKDGFDGDIEIALRDAPDGFDLQGTLLPRGRDHIRMTLTAPRRRTAAALPLRLEGWALMGERLVCRPAEPADNEMQAFLWRHLVPARELLVAVIGRGGRGGRVSIERLGETPLRLPGGGAVTVRLRTPPLPQGVTVELDDPPPGVSLSGVTLLPRGMTFTLRAGPGAPEPGYADNLIVQAFYEKPPKPGEKKKARPRRLWIGALPAIPVRIVEP